MCHGIQHGHSQIADCIDLYAGRSGLIGEDERITYKDVDIVAAGINHQTWYIKAQWRGMDLIPLMLELFEQHPEYAQTEKVRTGVLRRFGYDSTESNGHLSEYLPEKWQRQKHIKRGDLC